MSVKRKYFNDYNELAEFTRTHEACFIHSSQTSTVIPYDKIEKYFSTQFNEFTVGNLDILQNLQAIIHDGENFKTR